MSNKQPIPEKELKWSLQENYNLTKETLHCFKEVERGSSYHRYIGNKSLCRKSGVSDGDMYLKIKDIKESELNEKIACKTCLKIYKKHGK